MEDEVAIVGNGFIALDDARENYCRLIVARAGIVAAYKQAINPRVSDEEAMNLGTNLARVAEVSARITKLEEDRLLVRNITKDSLVADIARMYRVNACDYFDDKWNLKSQCLWTESMRMACGGIEQTKFGWKLELYGKDVIIDKISRMLGFDAPKQSEISLVNNVKSMSDADLMQIAAEDVEFEDVSDGRG